MKRIIIVLLLLSGSSDLFAQYVYTIKADSVKITKDGDSAELIIENHTRSVPGYLFNTGNGRTIFKRALTKLNDSTYLFGADTLVTYTAAGAKTIFQPLENQRLSSTNSPSFAGLTVGGHGVWTSANLDTSMWIKGGNKGDSAAIGMAFDSLNYKSGLFEMYSNNVAQRPRPIGDPWWNIINIRYANGQLPDGRSYGMQIASEMNNTSYGLYFRNQKLNVWTPWQTVWSSGNVIAGPGIGVSGTTLSNTGVTSFNTRTGAVTLTSTDVTNALGFSPNSQYKKFSASGISVTNTSTPTVIFTSASGSGQFIVTEVTIVTTTVPTSGSTSCTVNIGTNSTTYNNIVSGAVPSISSVNGLTIIRPTSYVVIPASTACDLKISTAGGTGGVIKAYVTGYYTSN